MRKKTQAEAYAQKRPEWFFPPEIMEASRGLINLNPEKGRPNDADRNSYD